ncbi:MAG: hypothetical protein H7Y04_11770 [Verrucomicrobia bacterium]|nr:hypothetical protein [Cytophagales bacterium]
MIEPLWKFSRKKAIDTHFYQTFEQLRQKILEFFQQIGKYEEELKSLVS